MNRNGRLSVILASLALPLTLLVGGLVTWYLKAHNLDNVDITAGLAYLRPILLSAFITFGFIMALALSFAIRGKHRDASPELSYLGIALIITVTLLSLASGVAQKGASDAEDAYRQRQAEAFFREVDAMDDAKQP